MAVATFEIGSRKKRGSRKERRTTIREVCLVKESGAGLPKVRSIGDRVELGGRTYRVQALDRGSGARAYVHLGPSVA